MSVKRFWIYASCTEFVSHALYECAACVCVWVCLGLHSDLSSAIFVLCPLNCNRARREKAWEQDYAIARTICMNNFVMQAYTAENLKGLTVEHQMEGFVTGKEVVLTLKDTGLNVCVCMYVHLQIK